MRKAWDRAIRGFCQAELGGKIIILLHGMHEHVEIVGGKTLMVQSGEVCGQLSGHRTVALLDLDKMHARILEL